MGRRFNATFPVDPEKWASPNPKMPPSDATSQYPLPPGGHPGYRPVEDHGPGGPEEPGISEREMTPSTATRR